MEYTSPMLQCTWNGERERKNNTMTERDFFACWVDTLTCKYAVGTCSVSAGLIVCVSLLSISKKASSSIFAFFLYEVEGGDRGMIKGALSAFNVFVSMQMRRRERNQQPLLHKQSVNGQVKKQASWKKVSILLCTQERTGRLAKYIPLLYVRLVVHCTVI